MRPQFEDIVSALGLAVWAGQALWDYLDELITVKERGPGGSGVLSRLVGEIDEDGDLTREDLVRIALALLIGGHDTTSQMIALGVVTLLEHPDRLAALRADPGVLPAAVDELLRMVSVTDVSGVRVATEDIDIDGPVIRAGEGVLVSSSMTDRDPAVFPDPYRFDVRRADGRNAASGRHHLTFGFGIHQCLGQNLARTELEVAFAVLFDRIPDLRLTVPPDRLPARGGGTMQGVHTLPVEW
ncbi:cytochrome P450 [Streptosporangium sp. NPDC023825]|uniref:cytochrome P450 n=1 Tax=Streptosporangium sp. NPDC023825 TaxID=3154909 RepID=UPI00343AABA0